MEAEEKLEPAEEEAKFNMKEKKSKSNPKKNTSEQTIYSVNGISPLIYVNRNGDVFISN